MRKPSYLLISLLACSAFLTSQAQAQSRSVIASNGVTVEIASDEFKPNRDISAPAIDAQMDERSAALGIAGYLFFSREPVAGGATRYLIQGFTVYSGDWANYDRAYLPGGVAVEFTSMGRDVGSCSRRGSCTLTENFQIELTRAQIEAVGDAGLRVQVGSAGGSDFVLAVPKHYIQAVIEITEAN